MLDVTANDIANVNTVGYKAERTSFKDALSQLQRGASAPTATLGGTNAAQVGLGVQLNGIDNLMQSGAIQSTGNPLDCAIQGDGMFRITDDPTGFGNILYTRAGNFNTRRQRRPGDARGLLRRRLHARLDGRADHHPDHDQHPGRHQVGHDRPGRHRHHGRLGRRGHPGGRHLAGQVPERRRASSGSAATSSRRRTTPGPETAATANTQRPRASSRPARSRCRTSTSPRSSPT